MIERACVGHGYAHVYVCVHAAAATAGGIPSRDEGLGLGGGWGVNNDGLKCCARLITQLLAQEWPTKMSQNRNHVPATRRHGLQFHGKNEPHMHMSVHLPTHMCCTRVYAHAHRHICKRVHAHVRAHAISTRPCACLYTCLCACRCTCPALSSVFVPTRMSTHTSIHIPVNTAMHMPVHTTVPFF